MRVIKSAICRAPRNIFKRIASEVSVHLSYWLRQIKELDRWEQAFNMLLD
ncbi:Uncharacterised protein [Enterobacter cloacae]|nr:Uncharacterised protein [Enterobacter cloacae]